MVTTLHPLTDDYPHADVGTIGDVAQTLHFELHQIGYSLLLDDVIDVLIAAATSYAAHTAFEVQTTATAPITLDRNLPISAMEWELMQPLCRAHCAVLQARCMDGTASLNGMPFGLSVSEAEGIYSQEQNEFAKAVFCAAPFTLELD